MSWSFTDKYLQINIYRSSTKGILQYWEHVEA
jgi:hypothetical protein